MDGLPSSGAIAARDPPPRSHGPGVQSGRDSKRRCCLWPAASELYDARKVKGVRGFPPAAKFDIQRFLRARQVVGCTILPGPSRPPATALFVAHALDFFLKPARAHPWTHPTHPAHYHSARCPIRGLDDRCAPPRGPGDGAASTLQGEGGTARRPIDREQAGRQGLPPEEQSI